MRQVDLSYTVSANIELSFVELKELWLRSRHHYDFKCKSVSQPGLGSFLWGWFNQFAAQNDLTEQQEGSLRAELDGTASWLTYARHGKVAVNASWENLDLCLKILEIPLPEDKAKEFKASRLAWQIHELLHKMRDETERLNPRQWQRAAATSR